MQTRMYVIEGAPLDHPSLKTVVFIHPDVEVCNRLVAKLNDWQRRAKLEADDRMPTGELLNGAGRPRDTRSWYRFDHREIEVPARGMTHEECELSMDRESIKKQFADDPLTNLRPPHAFIEACDRWAVDIIEDVRIERKVRGQSPRSESTTAPLYISACVAAAVTDGEVPEQFSGARHRDKRVRAMARLLKHLKRCGCKPFKVGPRQNWWALHDLKKSYPELAAVWDSAVVLAGGRTLVDLSGQDRDKIEQSARR